MSSTQKSYVVYRESCPGNWEEEGRFSNETEAVLTQRAVQSAWPLQSVEITEEWE